jgi:hypothetical protein
MLFVLSVAKKKENKMKSINKHPILTVSMVFIILMLFNNNLFSYISCNGSGSGYNDQNSGEDLTNNTNTIETLISVGAGYYLQGNSDIQSILNLVELQDVKVMDYQELQRLVNSALENITNSRLIYEKLVEIAEITPYNPVVIDKLKYFDYKTFMHENKLNEVIFRKVEGYLSDGDITGTLRHVLFIIKDIEDLLISVKTGMNFNRLELYWKLNELCAETTLFGSFIARVFHQIH